MSKIGQARVLSNEQFNTLLDEIQKHRHPEKNRLIFQISFKLGLRVQEISLLRVKEMAELGPEYPMGFRIKDVLVLPKGFTKGARAVKRSTAQSDRISVHFTTQEFNKIIDKVIELTKAGVEVKPEDYYPPQRKHGGKTRELPIVDQDLITAIKDYLLLRISESPNLKPNDPLILNQKGRAYSPNTLQDHMGMILKQWAGVDRASSHSGRRSLATIMLHEKGEHLKTVQQILGHKNAATTTIYQDVPETELRKVLKNAGESYSE
jgi:site-specific recombinase XerD